MATGVIGVITGGMALAAETSVAGAIVTVSGIANSIDDIGTNTQGDSFMQQKTNTQLGKFSVGLAKTGISLLGFRNDIKSLISKESSINQKITSAADAINAIVNTINSWCHE